MQRKKVPVRRPVLHGTPARQEHPAEKNREDIHCRAASHHPPSRIGIAAVGVVNWIPLDEVYKFNSYPFCFRSVLS